MARVSTYPNKTPAAADILYTDSIAGDPSGATFTVDDLTTFFNTNLNFGDFFADGTVPMAGALDLANNNIDNVDTLDFNGDLSVVKELDSLQLFDAGSTIDLNTGSITDSGGPINLGKDTTVAGTLTVNTDLNLTNGNLDDVATIDGGGDAVVFADEVDMGANDIINGKALYLENAPAGIYIHNDGADTAKRWLVQQTTGATIQWKTRDATWAAITTHMQLDWDNGVLKLFNGDLDMTDKQVKNAVAYTIDTETTNRSSELDDNFRLVEMNGVSLTYTVQQNATVAHPIGTKIDVANYAATDLTIAAGGTTVLRGNLTVPQYNVVTIIKRDTDEWYVVGGSA
jgi:hypothetical protein